MLVEILPDFLRNNYSLQIVALGSAILGVTSGALGCFAVLRRQSLLGDAISHAALPGVAVVFLLTRSKAPLLLIAGAAVAGWLATLMVLAVVRTTRIKYDSSLGLVMSVFFGLGLLLLSYIQKLPDARQAGLDRFLFGESATLRLDAVWAMAGLAEAALLLLVLFWKEFKLLSFDPDFAATQGFPVRGLDILLTSLIVIAIVVGLEAVGVVLMSTMLVAPGAAARQWTDRLAVMVVLAALFGALAGVSGAILSTGVRTPPGPTIVLCASAIVLFSLLLAPNRGLVWGGARHLLNRRRLRLEAVLGDLNALAAQHADGEHAHPVAVLQAMSVGHGEVVPSLRELERRGLAQSQGADGWTLTPEGRAEAVRLARGRGEDQP